MKLLAVARASKNPQGQGQVRGRPDCSSGDSLTRLRFECFILCVRLRARYFQQRTVETRNDKLQQYCPFPSLSLSNPRVRDLYMGANTCAVPLLTGAGERWCPAGRRARQRGAAPCRTGAAPIEVPTHHRWYAHIPKQ